MNPLRRREESPREACCLRRCAWSERSIMIFEHPWRRAILRERDDWADKVVGTMARCDSCALTQGRRQSLREGLRTARVAAFLQRLSNAYAGTQSRHPGLCVEVCSHGWLLRTILVVRALLSYGPA
ncbi:hypothetical protein BAUCODRAFT_280511 [Baudoinia panamericana UAMH 10762]|uniref:Uncharacterized protein n=1 Tax=Baudoinia panamericana (strain UAMH 10762) TaxID=717646 RepID=M2N0L4_BAUPA|nr:uncharacterized protein BAUCODRAFT_280511 [Baudoinia panamericana UAMH 10762]EMC92165.1 hypothetical protein BAUCODRAFT_280511 [Baudoinia panamericana UAMH 10762]